jgi:hypothetical protein
MKPMRTLWTILVAIVVGFVAQAQQQVNNFRVLTNLYVGNAITGVTLNGYNIDAIATNSAANKLDTTNGTAVLLTGSLTNVTLDGAALTQPFAYNAARSSGTNAYFNAGKITFPDGQVLTWAGGSVACIASRTNFVGINLFTGDAHALRRGVDMGTVFIGRVVCDGSGITSVAQGPIQLPPGRVERFKAAIQNGQHKLKLTSFGNSIMASAYGGATNKWMDAIFSASASPTTYQLPNTSGLTWKDYSYGGQKSREALMFLGQATTPLTFTNAHGASYVYGLDYISRNGTSALDLGSPAVRGADLAVFYDYFNGGSDNLLMIESAIRRLRMDGTEVVLCVDNRPRDTDPSTDLLYAAYQAIASTYGCAIADCQSYMEEQQAKGVTVHADTNHPNQAGSDAIAEAVRGVLNGYPLQQDTPPIVVPKGRAVSLVDYGYTNGFVPRAMDFQTDPSATTGTRVATMIDPSSHYITRIPSIVLGRRTTNDCVIELETGEYADFAHPFALGCDLIIESTNASTSITMRNLSDGVTISTLSPSADTPAVKLYELATPSMLFGTSPRWSDPTGFETSASPLRNVAVRFTCTVGTARIIGVNWHTVPWSEVRRQDTRYFGAWFTDTYGSLEVPATDTAGDAYEFDFTGNGCLLLFASHPAAGRVNVWLDGVQLFTNQQLRETGGPYSRSLVLYPALTAWNSADAGWERHHVRVQAVSATGGTPSAGNRMLMPLAAYALDLR